MSIACHLMINIHFILVRFVCIALDVLIKMYLDEIMRPIRNNQVANQYDTSLQHFIIQMESNQNQRKVFENEEITTVEAIQALSLEVKEVEFNSCKIGVEEWGPIVKALSEKQKLTKLTIYQYSIQFTEEQIKQLSMLSKLSALHLDGEFQGNWFTHICSMTNLRQLTLRGNQDNPISITQIEQIQKLTNLTKLTLNFFNINAKDASAISNLHCLTELDLNWNSVGNEGCREIDKMKNLTILKLWANEISDIGVAFLQQLTNLQQLQLGSNNIGSVGAAHLAKLKNLQILDLSQNNINDNNTKNISKMLSLRKLYLYDNKIGAEGISALCRLTKLEVLKIGWNNIGNEGICEVRKLTKLNKTKLTQCNIDSNGGLFIERMNNLKQINIRSNEINQSQIDKIKRRLPKRNIYLDL